MQKRITDDLDALLTALPPHVQEPLRELVDDRDSLLEVVMDLGRSPEARFPGREVILDEREVTREDLEYVVANIGSFGDDNRAGIERTLHRISAIRNRKGQIVGLTCRIGRAVYGTIGIIRDIIESGKSVLFLGRPGVGKTTMLREVARVLADDLKKRVVIVDTSNEIAGDGDIPHPAIGHARRMQVQTPNLQHAVMIEAVENHMPEVIIIDEIGTELEAQAARTIAERGVQLIGTAHGNTLENLMMNPTLADLIGGIQSVTLSDEEARRRGTQKSILERKAPPTFDVVVEIQSWEKVAVHPDVARTVDALLRGQLVSPQDRAIDAQGHLHVEQAAPPPVPRPMARARGIGYGAAFAPAVAETAPAVERPHPPPAARGPAAAPPGKTLRIYSYGVSQNRLEQAARELQVPVQIVRHPEGADAVITLKNYYRRKPEALRDAEAMGVPVYVLKSNTVVQMQQALASLYNLQTTEEPGQDTVTQAMAETEQAIHHALDRHQAVDLMPQNAYIRRLQHQMAERYNLGSRSAGKEPNRYVRIIP